jgi:hypothetical protein
MLQQLADLVSSLYLALAHQLVPPFSVRNSILLLTLSALASPALLCSALLLYSLTLLCSPPLLSSHSSHLSSTLLSVLSSALPPSYHTLLSCSAAVLCSALCCRKYREKLPAGCCGL